MCSPSKNDNLEFSPNEASKKSSLKLTLVVKVSWPRSLSFNGVSTSAPPRANLREITCPLKSQLPILERERERERERDISYEQERQIHKVDAPMARKVEHQGVIINQGREAPKVRSVSKLEAKQSFEFKGKTQTKHFMALRVV